jgi:hypothetical protein
MKYNDILIEDLSQSDLDREVGRYDPEKDNIHKRTLGDTRKSKLTLKLVNRMKKIRSTKRLEMAQKQDILGLMFGAPDEDESGGDMMM